MYKSSTQSKACPYSRRRQKRQVPKRLVSSGIAGYPVSLAASLHRQAMPTTSPDQQSLSIFLNMGYSAAGVRRARNVLGQSLAGPTPGSPSAEELPAATLPIGRTGPTALDDTLARWLVEADGGDVAAAIGDGGSTVLGAGDAARAAISWLLQALAHRLNVSDTFNRTLAAGVKLVVAGHAHLARAIQYQDGFYINTGTWADLMRLPRRLPREMFTAYARRLKEQFDGPGKASVCRPFQRLTYAEVDLVDGTGRLSSERRAPR